MRSLFFTLGLLIFSLASFAQSPSSKIMDASISWIQSGSQYTGVLNVYLTDTSGVAGLQVEVGTVADSADLHTAQYTISNGGSFWSTGTVDANNVLHVPIGSYAYHPEYFTRVRVILDDAAVNEIAIRSAN